MTAADGNEKGSHRWLLTRTLRAAEDGCDRNEGGTPFFFFLL